MRTTLPEPQARIGARAAAFSLPQPPTRVEKAVILFFVAFLLIFPKGGFKVAGVPFTWGYLGLGLFFLWFLLTLLSGRAATVGRHRLLVLALLLPFQALAWLGLLANGVDGFGFAISFVVTFFFIPLTFVLAFGTHLDRLDPGFLFRLLRFGVLAVAVYGIFLFFYKLFTGSFIEIPFLTVNVGDLGGLEEKFIDRKGIFKLISTYNNGNIYGISLLILLPLYTALERSAIKQLTVKASLVLTLSRTVWVGLLLYEILQRFYVKRLSLRSSLVLLISITLLLIAVGYLLRLTDLDVAFLFDRTLGGRQGQWQDLASTSVLPAVEFTPILEIVYLSILSIFGAFGLAFFLLGMTAPLLLYLARAVPFARAPLKRSLAVGLVLYLVMAFSDGAILYIPVMAFYWFVVSLLLSDNAALALEAPAAGVAETQAEEASAADRPVLVAVGGLQGEGRRAWVPSSGG